MPPRGLPQALVKPLQGLSHVTTTSGAPFKPMLQQLRLAGAASPHQRPGSPARGRSTPPPTVPPLQPGSSPLRRGFLEQLLYVQQQRVAAGASPQAPGSVGVGSAAERIDALLDGGIGTELDRLLAAPTILGTAALGRLLQSDPGALSFVHNCGGLKVPYPALSYLV